MIQNDKQHSDSGHSSFIHSLFTDLTWQQTVTQSISQESESESVTVTVTVQFHYITSWSSFISATMMPQCLSPMEIGERQTVNSNQNQYVEGLACCGEWVPCVKCLLDGRCSESLQTNGRDHDRLLTCVSFSQNQNVNRKSIMNHEPWAMNHEPEKMNESLQHCHIAIMWPCESWIAQVQAGQSNQSNPILQNQKKMLITDYWLYLVICNCKL